MTQPHPALSHPPSDLIGGAWTNLGPGRIRSTNPAHPERLVWEGEPQRSHVDQAVDAARRAFPAWAAAGMETRAAALRAYQALVRERADQIAGLLCDEAGKALWECKAEAGLLSSKVDITLDDQREQNWGRARIAGYELRAGETKRGEAWFRPHGVMAVLGPFNFPMHLPNGHIIPALLAGNTVVFKPSDKTPGCGQLLAELLDEALRGVDAPAGTFNLVQGDAPNAAALSAHGCVDGVLFTGSWPVGRKILEANLDRPSRIIALEMGGNNASVVMPDADLRQAAIEVARTAFNTTGQRCTSTRRLIVHESIAERFTLAIIKAASAMIVGDPKGDPQPFMGPLITEDARLAAMAFERRLSDAGGDVKLEMTAVPELEETGGHYVTPSVVRVPRFTAEPGAEGAGFDCGCDEEVFGPLLRVCSVADLDEAIQQANATRYGLSAAIFTKDRETIERFKREARAGCINVNCGTAGASSKLPFGGVGFSGNHRPAGAFALDYCAYPVASMTEEGDAAGLATGMTFRDAWI